MPSNHPTWASSPWPHRLPSHRNENLTPQGSPGSFSVGNWHPWATGQDVLWASGEAADYTLVSFSGLCSSWGCTQPLSAPTALPTVGGRPSSLAGMWGLASDPSSTLCLWLDDSGRNGAPPRDLGHRGPFVVDLPPRNVFFQIFGHSSNSFSESLPLKSS